MLQELIISANRSPSRADDPTADAADSTFRKVAPSILDRDDYTCQFCGFRETKMQEVHHSNGDHRINTPDNLVTACILCHLVHHIGFVGQKNMGRLIYFPELNQAELNCLVRTQWISTYSDDTNIRRNALSFIELMNTSTNRVASALGSNDPSDLAGILSYMSPKEYSRRNEILSGLRLFFHMTPFDKHIGIWLNGAYKQTPASTWVDIAENYVTIG